MITASTLICLEIVLSINLPPPRDERRLVAPDATFFKIRGAISINFAKGLNRGKGLMKSELKNWVFVRKFYRRAQPQFAFKPMSVPNPRMQNSFKPDLQRLLKKATDIREQSVKGSNCKKGFRSKSL